MNIFVAKLNFKTTSEQLQSLFEQFGEVSSAKVIFDKLTNRSKGYGFVEMPNDDQAYDAINQLNESELDGSTIVVKKARPKEEGYSDSSRFPRREGGYRQDNRHRGEGGHSGEGNYRKRY
ncbi:MAG: RNA-binding protein [Bacteroidales bacterium]|jgi:RNA recognition motif-containing protein|nr:RNA-binding protein [Bacteroidales bacterium]MCK9448601.1 RNA-binding protein [Bacteroidales bacterium]MDD3700985.1 RNA-binding protein [Bacteroidales bacterium]MDY0369123.1 RNA-binding protein [Bacteroidales bacterium]